MFFNKSTIASFILLAGHEASKSGIFADARFITKEGDRRLKPGKGGKGRGKGKGSSKSPSSEPSSLPSKMPSSEPSSLPSAQPSSLPSAMPSAQPSSLPSSQPSSEPSSLPSVSPSSLPSSKPSQTPSSLPSSIPSLSQNPSATPTQMPTQDDCFCASGAVEFVYQPIVLSYEAHVARAERQECILATIRNGDEMSAALASLPSGVTLNNIFIGLGRVGTGTTDADFLWADGTPYVASDVGGFVTTPMAGENVIVISGAAASPNIFLATTGNDNLGALYKCCEFGSTADFTQCNIIPAP